MVIRRCSLTERKHILLLSSKRARRKKIKELKASQPHITPWEGNEQIILETISNYNKDREMTGSSQHGFTK